MKTLNRFATLLLCIVLLGVANIAGYAQLHQPSVISRQAVQPITFEGSRTAATWTTNDRKLTVDITPSPMPDFCSPMLGLKAVARLTLHAGGSTNEYRFGTTTFDATIRGELVAYNGVGEHSFGHIELTIDQDHPEATFLAEATLLERSAFIDEVYGAATAVAPSYTTIEFRFDASGGSDPGFEENSNSPVEESLRVELVYEHVLRIDGSSGLSIRTYPDETYNTIVPLPGTPDDEAIKCITNSKVRLTWIADDEACDNDLNYVDGWQLQIAKVYNRDPTNATNPYKVKGALDWDNALTLTTDASARHFDVTLTEGEGIYAYRIRPVVVSEAHPDQARQGYGDWTESPLIDVNGEVEVDGYSNAYGDWEYPFVALVPDNTVSVFYHQSETERNRSYSRGAASETSRPLVNTEGMAFLDANLVARQQQAISRAKDNVIVSASFLDNEGRKLASTLAGPVPSMDQMSFKTLLNAAGTSGSGRPYDARDFDDNGKLIQPEPIPPQNPAATADNPISHYYSNHNANLQIPNADGFIASRMLLNTDGRPSAILKPGAITYAPATTTVSGKTYYGSVSEAELTSIFGAEAPAADNVTKTISITPDGVASARYVDAAGHVLATCLVGDEALSELMDGSDNIDENGSASLLELNGTTSSDNDELEKVNVLDIEFELKGGKEVLPGRVVASKRIVLANTTDVLVHYYPGNTDVESTSSCLDYCYQCDWKATITATRVDPVPLEVCTTVIHSPDVEGSPTDAPDDALFKVCSLSASEREATFTLGAGTWVIERVITLGNEYSASKTWMQEHEDGILQDVLPLDDIYDVVFDRPSSSTAEEQLEAYKSYMSTHGAYTPFFSTEGSPSGCALGLPAVQPCPVFLCVGTEDQDAGLEEYFIQEWLKSQNQDYGAGAIESFKSTFQITQLFRTDAISVTPPTSDKKIYPATFPMGYTGGWGLFEKMVENMMAETSPEYSCEQIWAAWKVAVATKLNSNADCKGCENVFESFLKYYGERELVDLYVGGNVDTYFYDNTDGYAFYAYKLVFCPGTVAGTYDCTDCPGMVTGATGLTYIDGAPYYKAVYDCVGTRQEDVDKSLEDLGIPPLSGPDGPDRQAVNQKMGAACDLACTNRRDEFLMAMRENFGETLNEAELLCRVESLVYECSTACAAAFPTSPDLSPSEAVVEEGFKRLYGVPHIELFDSEEPCENIAENPADIMYSTMLAGYLNQWYDNERKTTKTVKCLNVAEKIVEYMQMVWGVEVEIPECIETAAGYTVTGGDCSLTAPSNLRRFLITVLPNIPGRFYVNEGFDEEECEDCGLFFDGPTNYVGSHPLVPLMNDFLNDFWGMPVLDLGISVPTTSFTTKEDSLDRIYYTSWSITDNGLDYCPPLQARVNQLLTDGYTFGRDVNGSKGGEYSIWTATGFPYGDTPYDRPPITLYGEDSRMLSIVDSTKSTSDTAWTGAMRQFGITSFIFEKTPLAERKIFLWGLDRGGVSDTVITEMKWYDSGTDDTVATVFAASGDNDEIRPYTDTTFTALIGAFGQNTSSQLVFHDRASEAEYPIESVVFYRTAIRKLIGPEDCDFDELCLRKSCPVCVTYEFIDPRNETPERGYDLTDRSCAADEVARLENKIAELHKQKLESIQKSIRDQYVAKCTTPAAIADRTTVSYEERYYHYTLVYYDRAGRVQRTVPPKGVVYQDVSSPGDHRAAVQSHTMATSAEYTSLNERTKSLGPDVGKTEYWYNAKGLLRFVQSATQGSNPANADSLTYYTYDALGRLTETGEIHITGGATSTFTAANLQGGSSFTGTVTGNVDVAFTHHGTLASAVSGNWTPVTTEFSGLTQKGIRGRVSWTEYVPNMASNTTNVVRTYYSYDPHGNLQWEVLDVPVDDSPTASRLIKKTDYIYDQTLGTIVKTEYQKEKPDRFVQHYLYDEDGRTTDVYSSRDTVNWIHDAHYEYHAGGEFARTVLGEDRVQGVDYTFTLDGRLKGINHPTLTASKDPGKDGSSGAANELIAQDAFGLVLNYYEGDFLRQYPATSGTASTLNSASGNTDIHLSPVDLYGGVIGSVTYKTRTLVGVSSLVRNGVQLTEDYRYDKLGRIRSSTSGSILLTTHTSDASNGWASAFVYDHHGNQLSVDRSAMSSNSTSVVMDNIEIDILDASNVQDEIDETGAGVAGFSGDLNDMTAGNASVDASGRVVEHDDDNLSQEFTWNSRHDVAQIHFDTHEAMDVLRDAAGNIVRLAPNDDAGTYHYFVPGMARYSGDGDDPPTVVEWTINGAGRRLGVSRDVTERANPQTIYDRIVQTHFYELSDHVGSVRVVVADIRTDASNQNTPVLAYMSDYDVYGLQRPKRAYTSSLLTTPYLFGFQGMQSLADVGNLNMYSTPYRLYDARRGSWMSADPVFHPHESAYLGMGGNPMSYTDPMGLMSDWEDFWCGFKQGLKSAWNGVTTGASYAWEGVKKGGEATMQGVAAGLDGVATLANGFADLTSAVAASKYHPGPMGMASRMSSGSTGPTIAEAPAQFTLGVVKGVADNLGDKARAVAGVATGTKDFLTDKRKRFNMIADAAASVSRHFETITVEQIIIQAVQVDPAIRATVQTMTTVSGVVQAAEDGGVEGVGAYVGYQGTEVVIQYGLVRLTLGAAATSTPKVAESAAAAETGALSATQGAMLRMQLAAEEAAGARLPNSISGYTRHGLNSAISREGVGVSPNAIQDAWLNPVEITGRAGGTFTLVGHDATIVINSRGQIITTWPNSTSGMRQKP